MTDQPDQLYTLADAARRTGLSVDALRQRIKRGKLESVRGNDGLVKVRLTPGELGRLSDNEPSASVDQSVTSLVLESARLKADLARERDRADSAAAQAERERQRADAAAALAERRGEELRQQGERAARAEGEVAGLREALAEARRPAWKRWFGL